MAIRLLIPDRIGIWSVGFCGGRKTGENPWSKDENQQQTQPTYDVGSGIRTWDTLVEGERSHHCAIPASHTLCQIIFMISSFDWLMGLSVSFVITLVLV